MSNDLERVTANIAAEFGCGTPQACSKFIDYFYFWLRRCLKLLGHPTYLIERQHHCPAILKAACFVCWRIRSTSLMRWLGRTQRGKFVANVQKTHGRSKYSICLQSPSASC
jgi:hypothetical protein